MPYLAARSPAITRIHEYRPLIQIAGSAVLRISSSSSTSSARRPHIGEALLPVPARPKRFRTSSRKANAAAKTAKATARKPQAKAAQVAQLE
jgi:hypothetical protein